LEAWVHLAADAFDAIETAQQPFALDQPVNDLTGAGGSGRVEVVIFAGDFGALGGVFPGQDRRFCEDSRAEIGGDDAIAAGNDGGAAGAASVSAGCGGLGGGSHKAIGYQLSATRV